MIFFCQTQLYKYDPRRNMTTCFSCMVDRFFLFKIFQFFLAENGPYCLNNEQREDDEFDEDVRVSAKKIKVDRVMRKLIIINKK